MSTKTAMATGLTPTGVVVCTGKPLTDDWFAARREGITATDLPKILGDSPHGNAVSVWLDKRGEWDDDAGEEAEWGHELEPVVTRVWCRRNNTHAAPIEMLARKGAPWMRASLDRAVTVCPTGQVKTRYACGLEIKTRSAFVAGRWRDDMPDDVLAQVAWQRMVSGYPHIHVACLIGGQRLVAYTYHRDDQLEDFLHAEADRVWRHVLDGTPPEVDPDALLVRVLDQMYPHRDGAVEVPMADALSAIDAYEAARADETDALGRKERARAELVTFLGDHEVGLVENRPAFTYKAVPRRTIDTRRLRAEHPDLADDYTTTSTSRRLDIAKAFRKETR
ncbi:MAG: YqaJ viral recombinase family protein [Pseudonocardiaceae bacterium]